VTRDTRVALFATPLYADQLSEVETHLAAWRVAYAPLADNVRVDPHARGDLLLRLALAGVPHRHLTTSDEAFAHVGALTPQSVLDVQTRDALGADLAEGLRGIDGVADAQVIVAPASGGAYADEPARDASASVRLTLAPGAHLAAATLDGIRAFVAGGVAGLDPERVTVLDDRGMLGDAGADDAGLQASLQSALDAAFGGGATIVRVHREPLGQRREERDVKHVPLAGSLARTSADERYASPAKKYAKLSFTEERGNETHDVTRVTEPDATARLSVAVFVDGARALDLDAIRALAAATLGVDPARGDTLAVEPVRFASPPSAPRGIDAWAIAGLVTGFVPQVAVVAAFAGLVAFGARPVYALALRASEAAGMRDAARGAAGLPPARVRRDRDGRARTLPAGGARPDRPPTGPRGRRSRAAPGGIASCPRLTASARWRRGSRVRPRRRNRRPKWRRRPIPSPNRRRPTRGKPRRCVTSVSFGPGWRTRSPRRFPPSYANWPTP
jgi:flagellar biosynthesis/type III secretory pathway M-ring protein FliF/YscJ